MAMLLIPTTGRLQMFLGKAGAPWAVEYMKIGVDGGALRLMEAAAVSAILLPAVGRLR